MRKIQKMIVRSVIITATFCVLLGAALALSNLGLPGTPANMDSLADEDKFRLAEALHLREVVGDVVWPGWADAEIPTILYTSTHAFLIGYPDPPAGWVKVPQGVERGGPWEPVPGDTFSGVMYYRQDLPKAGPSPEAFAVKIGDRWVTSISTYDSTRFGLLETIRNDLPWVLRPVFPYQLFISQLISGDDQYISLIAHETFHAFQGQMAPEKLAAAENIIAAAAAIYPVDSGAFTEDWHTELNLLARALEQNDPESLRKIALEFLALRSARRNTAGLSRESIDYERKREWLEGLARYAELEVWRLGDSDKYQPIPETGQLPDFDSYTEINERWGKELEQMRRMASDDGDGRFYYSGMAQAYMLDVLKPDWKLFAFEEGIWLEDLISQAVGQ